MIGFSGALSEATTPMSGTFPTASSKGLFWITCFSFSFLKERRYKQLDVLPSCIPYQPKTCSTSLDPD